MMPRVLGFLGGLMKTDVIPTIDRTFERLEIRYKWTDSKAERMADIINIIKGCIFLIPIVFLSNVMLGDEGDPVFLVFLTPFFGFIAFFVYFEEGQPRLGNGDHRSQWVDATMTAKYGMNGQAKSSCQN
jgi:hypothetical protein